MENKDELNQGSPLKGKRTVEVAIDEEEDDAVKQ
jgi:hypothetical protein